MIDISKEIQVQELINKTAKEIANKLKEMTYLDETLETPKYYDNSKGTLYKVATERGWNSYIFDITKRDFQYCRNTGNKTINEFFKLRDEMTKQKTDSIVESVVNQFKERSKRGIEKYGTTLQENNTDDFLQHLKEELMDAILYIQKLQNKKCQNT